MVPLKASKENLLRDRFQQSKIDSDYMENVRNQAGEQLAADAPYGQRPTNPLQSLVK